jgi:hypothetical protein
MRAVKHTMFLALLWLQKLTKMVNVLILYEIPDNTGPNINRTSEFSNHCLWSEHLLHNFSVLLD